MEDTEVSSNIYACALFGAWLEDLPVGTSMLNDYSYENEAEGQVVAKALNMGVCSWKDQAVFVPVYDVLKNAKEANMGRASINGREAWEDQYKYVILRSHYEIQSSKPK